MAGEREIEHTLGVKAGENVGQPVAKHGPAARNERVRLHRVRRAGAESASRDIGGITGRDVVAGEYENRMAGTCEEQGRGEPGNTSADDDDPAHAAASTS